MSNELCLLTLPCAHVLKYAVHVNEHNFYHLKIKHVLNLKYLKNLMDF